MTYETRPGHQLILEQRERLVVTGVEEVARFDERAILLTTAMGELEILGEGLHIEKRSLDGGVLHVDGTVCALQYTDARQDEPGFLRRLLGV